MADIDRKGIAFGVILGMLGQAIYDTIFYLIKGQILEEWIVATAGLVTTILLLLVFYRWLFEGKETKTKK